MLNRIKSVLARIISAAVAVTVFILTIPLTIAAMIMMLFTGAVAMVVMRNRLRKMHIDTAQYSDTVFSTAKPEKARRKPPIEGSYSVVDK